MKWFLLVSVALGILCVLDVQQAGPLFGLCMVLAPIVLMASAARRTGRWLFGFHRTMRKNGLW